MSRCDPGDALLQRLDNEAQTANSEGKILTFDVDLCEWKYWQWPCHPLKNGNISAVGAGSFMHVPGIKYPICPHRLNPFRVEGECTMQLHLGKFLNGRKENYFQCTSHICEFRFTISNIAGGTERYLTTAEDINNHYVVTHGLEEEEEDNDTTISSPNSFPLTPPSSQGPAKESWEQDYNDSFVHHPDEDLLTILVNPRAFSPPLDLEQPRPQPLLQGQARPHRSFFKEKVAKARSQNDLVLMTTVKHCHETGLYKDAPATHPAYRTSPSLCAHSLLEPYNYHLYPNCLSRTFSVGCEFLGSGIGNVVRSVCSTLGVPKAAFDRLVADAAICLACSCIFSMEGFNAHISDGACRNWPIHFNVLPMQLDIDDISEIPARKYPPDITVESNKIIAQEYLDHSIGAMLLEWNSQIGVLQDVWTIVSTAYIECRTCELVRIFPAHIAHCNEKGECQDVGQVIAVIAR
ncbi:hypothetical protein EDD18DRAFT_1465281 [Armillaria luteobubalina]|uniref:Uncharacterized protein n=1 Tax=Armillaria luteobubalina TaxID=153913 RepID=A0AA39PY68_9AGAR|nr:hypothetical protein EDD18DRAFT_1465281 [Armillaria luteobubalina]